MQILVEVVIGQFLCGHGKQHKHAPWLKDNRECVDSPVHDQVDPPKRLSADESDGMRVLYAAPIKPVNFVRRTESKLDRLRACGRDRLQHNSTDQMSLYLVDCFSVTWLYGGEVGNTSERITVVAVRRIARPILKL